jgi:hypothetical protein
VQARFMVLTGAHNWIKMYCYNEGDIRAVMYQDWFKAALLTARQATYACAGILVKAFSKMFNSLYQGQQRMKQFSLYSPTFSMGVNSSHTWAEPRPEPCGDSVKAKAQFLIQLDSGPATT